ncbi:hypothetical protein [Bradyrhizobium liaoningense]
MDKTKPDRREVLAGAAAIAVSVAVPAFGSATLGPNFAAMLTELDRAMAALDAAWDAVVAARPEIYARVERSPRGIGAFFAAPEVRARGRARNAARAAAEEIIFAQASNDAESALQAKTKDLFFTRLGGDLMPPSRPFPET